MKQLDTIKLATLLFSTCLAIGQIQAHDSGHRDGHRNDRYVKHDSRHKDDESTAIYTPTYSPQDAPPGMTISESGERFQEITPERWLLHQENHDYIPIITGSIPPLFDPPLLDSIDDFALRKEDLVVINPAPDEFIWVMEGKRHGFQNMTIALTNTQPGGGAPLHTHVGEEAHVLLKGKMRYFLGDEEFVIEAPYIVHIPPMVPHAFINVNDEPAELVGIFPANEWEYDILDADVFGDTPAAGEPDDRHKRHWHQKKNRDQRFENYKEVRSDED